jgi:hypothetical protein
VSYNIDSWQVLEMADLRMPLSAWDEGNIDWNRHNRVKVALGEADGLIGVADENDIISVTKIEIYGECSGTDFDELRGALEDSTGKLDVLIIWEGGDSISRLTVLDGKVSHEDIDLVELLREHDRLKASTK